MPGARRRSGARRAPGRGSFRVRRGGGSRARRGSARGRARAARDASRRLLGLAAARRAQLTGRRGRRWRRRPCLRRSDGAVRPGLAPQADPSCGAGARGRRRSRASPSRAGRQRRGAFLNSVPCRGRFGGRGIAARAPPRPSKGARWRSGGSARHVVGNFLAGHEGEDPHLPQLPRGRLAAGCLAVRERAESRALPAPALAAPRSADARPRAPSMPPVVLRSRRPTRSRFRVCWRQRWHAGISEQIAAPPARPAAGGERARTGAGQQRRWV